jgi:hypothetical protein
MDAPGSSRTIAAPVAAVVAPAISSFFASQLRHTSGLRRLGGGGVFRRRRTLASAQLRMLVGRHPGGPPQRHQRFGPEGARRLEPSGRCGQADRDLVMTRPGSINRESRRRPLTHNREARHLQCLDQRIAEPERIVCEIAVWWRWRSACCRVAPACNSSVQRHSALRWFEQAVATGAFHLVRGLALRARGLLAQGCFQIAFGETALGPVHPRPVDADVLIARARVRRQQD